MRQRATIAMALACDPVLLIADEPTTALDVTIQAQILDLMQKLQQDTGMGMLFVTHNLGVVAEIAHRVAVMYAGRVVEDGPVAEVFRNPRHPYTVGLLQSMPKLGDATRMKAAGEKLAAIPGVVPSLRAMPPGCAFAPRCPWAIDACRAAVPALEAVERPAPQPLHPLAGGPPMTAPALLGVPRLAVRDLGEVLPLARRRPCASSRTSPSTSPRARSSASSASPAAARPPSAAPSLRLIEPTAGAVTFDGTELTTLSPAEMRRQRPRMQYIFQDPFASLSPRMTIGEILTEGLKIQGIGTASGTPRPGAQGARERRPAARRHRPLRPRVLRRPAPAHRHRPRAGARARVHRRRRAGLGPRRLDPGADRSTSCATCSSASA